jgi:hypothetical protein
VRYAALQMLFPEEAKSLHTRLEAEFADRYAALKRKADAELWRPSRQGNWPHRMTTR